MRGVISVQEQRMTPGTWYILLYETSLARECARMFNVTSFQFLNTKKVDNSALLTATRELPCFANCSRELAYSVQQCRNTYGYYGGTAAPGTRYTSASNLAPGGSPWLEFSFSHFCTEI